MRSSLAERRSSSTCNRACRRAANCGRAAGRRAVPDQLRDSVSRAGLHSMAGKHRDLPDLLHQHRADGLLPGCLGRLPGLRRDGSRGSARSFRSCFWRRPRPPGSLWIYERFGQIMIDVGSQQSPQLIYFGTERAGEGPVEVGDPDRDPGGYFFVLVALLFVGLGQEMGRRFAVDREPDARLLGRHSRQPGGHRGLRRDVVLPPAGVRLVRDRHGAGGLLRSAAARAACPRAVWRPWRWSPGPTGRSMRSGVATEVTWSPYYQVRFKPRYMSIDVNNIGHQGMLRVDSIGLGLLPAVLAESRRGRQAV